VQVVQREHERLAGGQPLHQLADRVMSSEALGRGLRVGRSGPEVAQRREDRAQLSQPVGDEPLVGVGIERLQIRVEGVHHETEGQLALELRGPALQYEAVALLRAAGELREQARLADPRLAADDDEARLSGARLVQQPGEHFQLAVATDQR
jgi:hypothetical protein